MREFIDAFAPRERPPRDEWLDPSVGAEGDVLRDMLGRLNPVDLTPADVRLALSGNLWMLAAETFVYLLPALMGLTITHDELVSDFGVELVAALTEPMRGDVVEALDELAEIPPGLGLAPEVLRQLRAQQLEWFDSGQPHATYIERLERLSVDERTAILKFLMRLDRDHGGDFPSGELQSAVDRHLRRYPHQPIEGQMP